MRWILLSWLFGVLCLMPWLHHAPRAFASEEFDTSLTTTYTVDQTGVTRVKHDFSITNLTPTTFIKQYTLTTAYSNLTNFRITENGVQLEPTITDEGNRTLINISFPRDIVGEGKTRNFQVEYTNPELAMIGGKVLEVHIPELSDSNLYDRHTVIIQTPLSFGEPARSTPKPFETKSIFGAFETRFDNTDGSAISVMYGSKQYYNLAVRYNLENSTASTALTQLALPPDTSFQRLYYHSLDPAPANMKRDDDGNWIATYELPPNSVTPVHLTALAEISLDPLPYPVPAPKNQHTNKDEHWDTGNRQISNLAKELATPEKIYDFLIGTLTYNTRDTFPEEKPRLGAVQALSRPTEVLSQDYTDLFIALSRAAGIPARRAVGYAFSQNEALRPNTSGGNNLHAWPEYYDQSRGIWVPIDPAWGDTTGGVDYFHQFDLRHLTLAINGISSTTPFPVGTYQSIENEENNLEISFAEGLPEPTPSFGLMVEPIRVLGMRLPGLHNLKITNQSGHAWYDIAVALTHDYPGVTVNKSQSLRVPVLLPFQTVSVPLTAHTNDLSIKNNVEVTAAMLNSSDNSEIYAKETIQLSAGPAAAGYFQNPQVLVGVGVGLALLAIIAGSVLVFRRK